MTEQITPAVEKLTKEVDDILAMATDLRNRGHHDEAAIFALAAAERLKAIRAIMKLEGWNV